MATDTPSMAGKVCLITGATSGIGLVAAEALAAKGATLVLAGRNPDKCDAVARRLRETTSHAAVETLVADMSSQQQVRRLAEQFLQRHQRLDVLINNAGAIWFKRHESVDGIEMTFAVNHLGYFLLTNLLLDVLKASAPSRVVNVSSDAHAGVEMPFDDLMMRRHYRGFRVYKISKLANLLFTFELARRLQGTGVTVNALHPGMVATGFGANNGFRGKFIQTFVRLFGISPETGARTIVYLATSPEVAEVSGQYFVKCLPVVSSPASRDEQAAKRLWQVSEELTGLAVART